MLKNSLRIENCVHNAFEKFKESKKEYSNYCCVSYAGLNDGVILIILINDNIGVKTLTIRYNFATRYKDIYDAALYWFNKKL